MKHFYLQQLFCSQDLVQILSETNSVFSNEDATFVISCFVILFLCLTLLEARVWTTAGKHWELKTWKLFALNTTFAVTSIVGYENNLPF